MPAIKMPSRIVKWDECDLGTNTNKKQQKNVKYCCGIERSKIHVYTRNPSSVSNAINWPQDSALCVAGRWDSNENCFKRYLYRLVPSKLEGSLFPVIVVKYM